MDLSRNLSPFNFLYDNSKQNYSNCDISGSFYEVKYIDKRSWYQTLSAWIFGK